MKISRRSRARVSRPTRELSRASVRTPHCRSCLARSIKYQVTSIKSWCSEYRRLKPIASHLVRTAVTPPSPRRTGIGFTPIPQCGTEWSFGLMCYRSATVAGSHGLPRWAGQNQWTLRLSDRWPENRNHAIEGILL